MIIKSKVKLISLFLVLISLYSCKDEELKSDEGFIKVYQQLKEYYGTECLELANGNLLYSANTGKRGDTSSQSTIFCFDPNGKELWQRYLTERLEDMWDALPDESGGFYLTGFGYTATFNPDVTVIHYNEKGQPLKAILLPGLIGDKVRNTLDMIRLRNGDIALFMNHHTGSGQLSMPRLIVLSPDLEVIHDKIYYEKPGTNYTNVDMPRIREAADGTLYVCGVHVLFFPTRSRGFLFKFSPNDYRLTTYKVFSMGEGQVPGPFELDENGNLCITTAQQFFPPSSSEGIYFEFRKRSPADISIGKKVSVYVADTALNLIARHDFDEFPNLGCITGMSRSSDGGYLFAGTCNMYQDREALERATPFILKTNANFKQEWLRVIGSTRNASTHNIVTTRNGDILMTGTIQSVDGLYNPLFFKLNSSGY